MMDRVAVIVVGQEPSWLREQFRHLLGQSASQGEFAFSDWCEKGASTCVVLTDDLRGASLRRVLFECVDRVRGDGILVLAWDEALHAVELLRIPLVRLYFPRLDPQEASAALGALFVHNGPSLVYQLDPSLPASLAIGLRIALDRCGDPFGPPPPRLVSELAVLVRCKAPTLYRAAANARIDLTRVLSLSRARWVLVRSKVARDDPDQLARRLGYESARSLRRLLSQELGVSLSRLRDASLERIDSRLRSLLETASAA